VGEISSLNSIIELMMDDQFYAKVADFGLSRLVAPKIDGQLNTWQWMAPETLSTTSEYDLSADVYSFGIVLWEMVSFSFPFDEYSLNLNFGKYIKYDNCDVWEFDKFRMINAIVENNLRPSIPSYCPVG
jgi:serine/threonine protein kinase